MPGLILDRYEPLKPLAQGGMGEVLLARQTGVQGFERLVVLKSLRADLATDGGFIDQFLDEARVAATLNHPNIVHIFEVGEWQGAFYIVMEFIDGVDLSRLWYASAKRGVGLPFQVTVKVVEDAARGLDHAHHARDVHGQLLGVVHRDVSPQNIMLRRDGVVKIVDFGIAKAKNRVSSTVVGTVKGKLQYMAPEQVRGEPLDGRSDQFSLGIVLWEMCTGKRLFKADSELATLNKVMHHAIEPPSTVVTGFPAELESVLMRMLERDPEKRYPTCGAVAKELSRYLERVRKHGRDVTVSAFVEDILGADLDARATELSRLTRAAPIKRSSPEPSLPPRERVADERARRASVRVSTKDGTEIEFPHLDDVEKAVREGRVGPFDILSVEGKAPIALGADDRYARLFTRKTHIEHVQEMALGAPAVVDPPFGPTSAWTPERAPVNQHPTPAAPTPTRIGEEPMRGPAPMTRFDPRDEVSDLELARALRRSWVRPMLVAAGVALLVTAGALLVVDDGLRARLMGTAETSALSQTLFDDTARALRSHDRAAIVAAHTALDAATVAPGSTDATLVDAWRARLHAALASIEGERARLKELAGDESGAREASARSDEQRILAYRAATGARARGERIAEARLAMASYHALRGARPEVMLELKAAVDVEGPALRAGREQEGRVLLALFETERALEALAEERGEAIRTADDAVRAASLDDTNKDARLAYARTALVVERARDPAAVGIANKDHEAERARAKDAVAAVTQLLPGDDRVLMLAARLDSASKPTTTAAKAGDATKPTPPPSSTGPSSTGKDEPTRASEPASPDALVRDADRARERGSTWKAIGLYKQAIKLRSNHVRALIGLGWAHIDVDKADSAVSWFQRARSAAPDEGEAVFGHAEALRAAGDIKNARAAYTKFIAMEPSSSDAAIAKRALARLPAE